MCFDKDGFLWLGVDNLEIREIISNTQKPFIQRFNGESFHTILLPKTDSKILSVNQLFKRKDGQFYIKANLETETLIWLFRR